MELFCVLFMVAFFDILKQVLMYFSCSKNAAMLF